MNIAKHIMIQTFFISIGLFYYCLNDIDLRQIAFKALILSYLSMLVVCQIDRERMIAEQEG